MCDDYSRDSIISWTLLSRRNRQVNFGSESHIALRKVLRHPCRLWIALYRSICRRLLASISVSVRIDSIDDLGLLLMLLLELPRAGFNQPAE